MLYAENQTVLEIDVICGSLYICQLFFQCFCNVLMSLLPKYLSFDALLFAAFGEMLFVFQQTF